MIENAENVGLVNLLTCASLIALLDFFLMFGWYEYVTREMIFKDPQSLFSGKQWNPNITLNIPMLSEASGSRSKVTWNPELEAQY